MIRKLLFRNFRFIYRVSRWLRYRLTPGGSLILGGLVASGIFGIDTRQSLAFQIFAVCASLMLFAVLTTLIFRARFRLRRHLPEYATAGVPFQYKLRIENPGRRRQYDLLLIDELTERLPDYQEFITTSDPKDKNRNWLDRAIGYPRLISLIHKNRGGAIPAREIPPVPAYDMAEVDIEFVPARRGYLNFSAAYIARPDPLGLFRALRKYPLPDSQLVLPRIYPVSKLNLPGKRKYRQGGLSLASQIGDSQEFLSLREYQPGDPLRSIHWRSYAKYGEPVVKEYQDEYFVRQGLALDTFIEHRNNNIFEEAVSVAASFQLAMEEQDSLLDLMFVGNRAYRFTSGRGFGKSANILEVLACVEPCKDQTPESLESLLLRHVDELSGMVMILMDWDSIRRSMAAKLVAAGIPTIVFVLIEDSSSPGLDPGPLYETPERLVALPMDNIETSLQKMTLELSL
ncbi:MAG: DUF58 domain-containing protein [Gammaproteobacteria bacterium]